MNPYYNQKYSREEVAVILSKIKDCVMNKRYTISKNEHRKENINFIEEYNIRSAKQEAILLHMKPEDFCHSVKNRKKRFEHEDLYVFAPQVKLFNAEGEEEFVDIYTKFNIIDLPDSSHTVVISFHKLNKPIDYLFR